MTLRSRLRPIFGKTALRVQLSRVLLILSVVAVAFPPLAIPALLGGIIAWALYARKERFYPLRAPLGSGLDPGDMDPARCRPLPARGTLFLGYDEKNREVWLSDDDVRQHLLLLGETGSGKTAALLGLSANALSWGSGFMFVDSKGDISLLANVSDLCRKFGRTKDLVVLNFLIGSDAVSLRGQQSHHRSHQINPFQKGSPTRLTRMLSDILEFDKEIDPRWKLQAIAMLDAVMECLCWKRDHGGIKLDASVLRNNLTLQGMIDLADDPEIPDWNKEKMHRFLSTIPCYDELRGKEQSNATKDHVGYIAIHFCQILGVMADVYGHIFRADGTDVDLVDIIVNRRVLVVMLPPLGRMEDERKHLGKIIMTMLKATMAELLLYNANKTWEDVVGKRQIRSQSPFLIVFDSIGSYAVEGMALMAAQARALGLGLVYSENNIDDLEMQNQKESQCIIANTNTKLLMKCNRDAEDETRLGIHGPPLGNRTNLISGQAIVISRGRRVATRIFYCGRPDDREQYYRQLKVGQLLTLDNIPKTTGINHE